ncbi:hypothetical protein [Gordonia terrae]|uniref:hypothetical protein n=1 Tax=Gordonia terrae TaxID=2055 RepID=UPI003F6B8207
MPPIERRTVRYPIDRRTALRGGLVATVAVAGAGMAGLGLTGCDSSPSAETLLAESLVPLVRSALADEGAARALTPLEPGYAAALTVVADQRAQHARALREEIIRLDQDVAGTLDRPSASTSPSTPGPSSAPGTPPRSPSLAGLRADLASAGTQARDLALSAGGYASGLSGSISAAITSMREVQLA